MRRYQDRFVAFDVLYSLLLEGVQSERILLSGLRGGSVGVVWLPVHRVHRVLRWRWIRTEGGISVLKIYETHSLWIAAVLIYEKYTGVLVPGTSLFNIDNEARGPFFH